jgi:hypothetical protein
MGVRPLGGTEHGFVLIFFLNPPSPPSVFYGFSTRLRGLQVFSLEDGFGKANKTSKMPKGGSKLK